MQELEKFKTESIKALQDFQNAYLQLVRTLTIDNDTVEVNTVSVSNSDGESVDNNLHCKVL